MKLIYIKDIQIALGLKKLYFIGYFISFCIYHLTLLSKINLVYKKIYSIKGYSFFSAFLKETGVDYTVHPNDLKRIPLEGSFIVVSNHPTSMDGVIMSKLISDFRKDYKIMANFVFAKVEPINNLVLSVNPFENNKDSYSSFAGIKNSLLHIKNGGCIGVFPSGEISRKNFKTNEIEDKEWDESILKLLKKSNTVIIPMYFHIKNSNFFYRLASIHPMIQTALLPRLALGLKNKKIKVRIGKPITVKQQQIITDISDYGLYLRNKVYMLKSYYDKDKNKQPQDYLKLMNLGSLKENVKVDQIAFPTSQDKQLVEIEKLKKSDSLLFKNSVYEAYFTKAENIPYILREIGRLREITFRSIGEGTNKSIDLDKFDTHYHHLFLWNTETLEIVGAYRLGMGKEIYEKFGIEGFYVNTLFNFEPEIIPFFKKGIEMGRAFIRNEYQQKPLPLFLLWNAIIIICLKYPYYKYLVGGVSISNQFSNFSKSLLVEFMRSHYFDTFVGQFVNPKKEFKVKLTNKERELFFGEIKEDINKLDKLIDELEPTSIRIPVLIKKYFKQNAKVISFNVDPDFNDVIDGLMYIRIKDIPEETVKPIFDVIQNEIAATKKANLEQNN